MPIRTPPPGSPPPAPATRATDAAPAATTTAPAGSAAPATAPAADAASFDATPGSATAPAVSVPGGTNALTARLALLTGGAPLDPAMLATPQGQQQALALIKQLMADPAAAALVEVEVWKTLDALENAGALVPVLGMLADEAITAGALPAMPPAKKDALVLQFSSMVSAELSGRGLGDAGAAGTFKPWAQLSAEHLALVRDTQVPPAGPPAKSAFTDARFVKEMEELTGAEFKDGSKITPLIDGPASFAERNALIDGAKTSIHMLTWAFYDDETGRDTAARLVAKHKAGVDVKIIVDGNVAGQHGSAVLKTLEDAGITVVRWNDPQRPSDGQHRKSMVVDGKVAIAGGLNVGNMYSHMGPAGGQKWRDTDVKLEGRAVRDASKLFARVFNEQVDAHGLPFKKVDVRTRPRSVGTGSTAVVDDTPGPAGNANILVATLKAIEGATKRVDIENAYFISTPALKDALIAALERGVQVRILTNSGESVDEPIVSAPILMSLPDLIAKGAEVYLKKGDTLHSKFLIVDDMFTSVGSYNLHPRSERYEGEVAFNAIDTKAAASLTRAFEADIAAADHPQAPTDVKVPQTAFSMLASRFFFNQL